MKILHSADLHLSAKEGGVKEYSFAVLDEILQIAKEESCQAVLICGDLFEDWQDLVSLRKETKNLAQSFKLYCPILFIPGNHDILRAPSGEVEWERLDLDPITVCYQRPFTQHTLSEEVEVLALPYAALSPDYRDWKVPPKRSRYRVLATHGTVIDMVYAGPKEENDSGGEIVPELAKHLGADCVCLGHIHGPLEKTVGGIPFVYPGSARVWREGEEGPRSVVIWEFPPLGEPEKVPNEESSPSHRRREVRSAGRFVSQDLEVALDGSLRAEGMETFQNSVGPADWVQFRLVGITEDGKRALEQAKRVAKSLEGRCRKVTIDEGGLETTEGISTSPLARDFLSAWEKQYREATERGATEKEQLALRYARLYGLKSIQEVGRGKR